MENDITKWVMPKVVKIKILDKIREGSQDCESRDRNTDCKILPNSQFDIYMAIHSSNNFEHFQHTPSGLECKKQK